MGEPLPMIIESGKRAPLADSWEVPKTPDPQTTLKRRPVPSPAPIMCQTRDESFVNGYPEIDLLEGKILDLTNTLIHSKVEPAVRARMIDWIVEVFTHFQASFSFSTFFRTILVLDQFLKYTSLPVANEDVHLVGLTSMYIASKYEDMFHIRIKDFASKAAHNKFSPAQIRESENLVLSTCGYCVSYKTPHEIAGFYFARVFTFHDDELVQQAKKWTVNFLVLCSFQVTFNNYDARLIVLACVLASLSYIKEIIQQESRDGQGWEWLGRLRVYEAEVRSKCRRMLAPAWKPETAQKVVDMVAKHLAFFDREYPESKHIFRHIQLQKQMVSRLAKVTKI
jgi:hypothetical protein